MAKTRTMEFVALIIVLLYAGNASAMHTYFCFRFPKESFPDATYASSGTTDVVSTGMEKFPPQIWKKYSFKDDVIPGGGEPPTELFYIDTVSGFEVYLTVYNVQGRLFGGDEPLSGWYRVQVSLSLNGNFQEYIKSFILFATDEQFNTVGEWVHNFPTFEEGDCPRSDATPYMLINCGGISKYEPFAPNVVVFARNYSKDGDIWPNYPEHRPIVPILRPKQNRLDFYFRHTQHTGNMNANRYIIFRIIADPDHTADFSKANVNVEPAQLKKGLLSQTAWFKVRDKAVPGAADPLPTKASRLQCTERLQVSQMQILFYQVHQSGPDAYINFHWQWYIDIFSDSFLWDVKQYGTRTHYANSVYSKTGCIGKHFEGRCKETMCSIKSSGSSNRNQPSSSLIPQWHSAKLAQCSCPGAFWECVKDSHADPAIFNNVNTPFSECLDHLKDSVAKSPCNMTKEEAYNTTILVIRKPRNGTAQNETEKDQQKKFRENVNARGIRVFGFGTLLYAIRKGHGLMMTIASLFFLPVSIFTSRYFKETYMSTRILYSRVWLQVHIQCVFWMFAFYFAGMLLALVGRGLLGSSLVTAGLVHRVLGWLSILLFFILGLTGGIRAYPDPGRWITICLHWALGVLLYIFNLMCIIGSLFIPGCPSADHEQSVLYNRYEPKLNRVIIALVIWHLYEVFIFLVMTYSIHRQDRFMHVEEPRRYIPPIIGVPIPVIRENTHKDASGHGFRFIMLWVYIGCALLVTATIGEVIVEQAPKARIGFGPMWCTHNLNPDIGDRFVLLHKMKPECQYM